jgi:LAS superfamily LD-carboxypeptidase LdcB
MSSLSGLHPLLVPWAQQLVRFGQELGLNPIVTSVRRSYASQRRLYDLRQRTLAGTLRPGEKPQRYPVAKPGTSDHEFGLAWDMVSDDNARLGAIWRSWGGQWSPSDSVHFFVR